MIEQIKEHREAVLNFLKKTNNHYEALKININLNPKEAEESIRKFNFAFS